MNGRRSAARRFGGPSARSARFNGVVIWHCLVDSRLTYPFQTKFPCSVPIPLATLGARYDAEGRPIPQQHRGDLTSWHETTTFWLPRSLYRGLGHPDTSMPSCIGHRRLRPLQPSDTTPTPQFRQLEPRLRIRAPSPH